MNTLNIFCDASISKLPYLDGEVIGCPGYICMTYNKFKEDVIIDTGHSIIRHSTNNESEITAILMGVNKAVELKDQFTTINLFSDSRICIQSLRNWIFNWVNNRDENGMMYGSNKNYVANQQIISRVVNTIIRNNLKINLLHQKGHVNIGIQKHINDARELFESENHLNGVSDDFIKIISYYNNMIDQYTKDVLKEVTPTFTPVDKYKGMYPLRFMLSDSEMRRYAELINRV